MSLRHLCFSWVFIVIGLFGPVRAVASESIGKLELTDLFLEPGYFFHEGFGGAFQLGSSYVEMTWRQDQLISGVVKVGTKRLIGVPARYARLVAPDEIAIVEGYAQLDSVYGRVRAGMIPIVFGLEGGDVEPHLRLPRSLPYQARYLNLRDIGLSYRISVNRFFSEWAVHNGEGGTDQDREAWFTARWGWDDERRFRLGISGVTGRTTVASTDPGGAMEAVETGFKFDKDSRLRIANFFVEWRPKPVRLALEATAGDTFQGDDTVKFRALHADIDVRFSDSFGFLTRYDVMNPRSDVADAEVTEYTAGVAWSSRYENSTLYFLGSKRVQNKVPDNHRTMVVWRLTPLASAQSRAF